MSMYQIQKMQNESLLKSTQNTRDLGGYSNLEGKVTKYHSLIRSDYPEYPCKEDIDFLKSYGITTVIDVRGLEEVSKRPSGLSNVDGFEYYNFPVDEGSGVPESKEEVPFSYMRIAEAAEMPNVFRCMANVESGVIYNCTAGKDRTGVISAILLLHAGISDDNIIQNYTLTKEYIREKLNWFRENVPEIDIDIITPYNEYMEEFLRLFRSKFDSTIEYFKNLGLTEGEIKRLRNKLLD